MEVATPLPSELKPLAAVPIAVPTAWLCVLYHYRQVPFFSDVFLSLSFISLQFL